MGRKRYPGISYWAETDPKGGWRAVVVCPGGELKIHECATHFGADFKARSMARKAHRAQQQAEMWRRLNGYEA